MYNAVAWGWRFPHPHQHQVYDHLSQVSLPPALQNSLVLSLLALRGLPLHLDRIYLGDYVIPSLSFLAPACHFFF